MIARNAACLMRSFNLLGDERFCWREEDNLALGEPSVVYRARARVDLSSYSIGAGSRKRTIEHHYSSDKCFPQSGWQRHQCILKQRFTDNVELIITLGVVERVYPFFDRFGVAFQLHRRRLNQKEFS